MTEIDIRKDRFATREESGSWGHVANWYTQRKEISRVNIDTTHGDIEVYIDGKPVAPRQNPKPKRFVLPMEGTEDEDGDLQYAKHYEDGTWGVAGNFHPDYAAEYAHVTQADLDDAPAWVKAIKPVEVKD